VLLGSCKQKKKVEVHEEFAQVGSS